MITNQVIQKCIDDLKNISKVDLTTDDLTKLFDTEFKFDYINGTAEITNTEA